VAMQESGTVLARHIMICPVSVGSGNGAPALLQSFLSLNRKGGAPGGAMVMRVIPSLTSC